MNYEISKVCTFQVENMQAFENLSLWQNSIHLSTRKQFIIMHCAMCYCAWEKGSGVKKEK